MVPLVSRRLFPILLALGGCVIAPACSHAPLSRTPEGNASFRFIEPPVPAPPKGKVALEVSQKAETFIPAAPLLPLAMPVYPAVALRSRSFGTSVSVHVLVDAKGRVAQVTPSLFGFTMPSPYGREFFEAVEQAVLQWKFKPAEFQFVEPGAREGAEVTKTVARHERVETEFDVAFLFTSTGAVVLPK